jgi:hypothetical protein
MVVWMGIPEQFVDILLFSYLFDSALIIGCWPTCKYK